jgi:hypothetical protein
LPPTETPVPTATITPTPTVAPPEVVLEYLDGVVVTRVDTFDSDSRWGLGGGEIADGRLELVGNDWNGLVNQGLFLEGEGTIISFNYGNNPEFEIFYDFGQWWTDAYRRFGIYVYSGYPKANLWLGKNGLGYNNLQGNFQPKADTWYKLLMAVDVDGEFLAVIWDPADPSQRISYHEKAGENWADYRWHFRIGANAGTILFDDFIEIDFTDIK